MESLVTKALASQTVDPLDARLLRLALESRLRKEKFIVRILLLAFGVGAIFAWEMASRHLMDPFWISQPTAIVLRLWEWFSSGFIFPHLWISCKEMGIGFTIGLVSATVASIFLATRKVLANILDPFMMAIWSVPGIILGPLFILYFGIGFTAKMVLVAVSVFFLVFFTTFTGIRSIDKDWIDSMRLMGASGGQIFRKVMLPASAIWILASFKNAIPYTLVAAVAGELMASIQGIGYLIKYFSGVLDTTGVFAALVTLMVMGMILNEIVERTEKWVLRWKSREQ